MLACRLARNSSDVILRRNDFSYTLPSTAEKINFFRVQEIWFRRPRLWSGNSFQMKAFTIKLAWRGITRTKGWRHWAGFQGIKDHRLCTIANIETQKMINFFKPDPVRSGKLYYICHLMLTSFFPTYERFIPNIDTQKLKYKRIIWFDYRSWRDIFHEPILLKVHGHFS